MGKVEHYATRLSEIIDRMHPSGLLYSTYEGRLLAQLDRSRLPQHVAVLADGVVLAVGTIPELLQLDHPWIQEYFRGPRGRAALKGAADGNA